MSHPALTVALLTSAAVLALASFLAYAAVRYAPIIGRIFEEKPLFLPLRLPPAPGGEGVRFPTADGLELAGTYLRATTPARVGVLVFCHEFLSDRWSFQPYLEPLRARGFAGDLSSTHADRTVLATDNSIYHVTPEAIAFPRGT